MSGAGRKHRAKHATDAYLDDSWDGSLAAHEVPGVVTSASKGGKTIEVRLHRNGALDEKSTVVTIPGKFHKVIWVLRGDVVLVEHGDTMARKLSPSQIKTLAVAFPALEESKPEEPEEKAQDDAAKEDDLEDLVNPNFRRCRVVAGTSSDDDDEEEEGEEEEGEEA